MSRHRSGIETEVLRQLRRRGAAFVDGLSVKVLGNYPVDGRHSFQLEDGGERYVSPESWDSIETAAEAAAVAAAIGIPELALPYEPEVRPSPAARPSIVAASNLHRDRSDERDARNRSVESLVSEYKMRGIDRGSAWSRFVIDRSLSPGMDARDFYAIWDGKQPAGKRRKHISR